MRLIIKGLFVAINVVAVVLLFASTLAGTVPPSHNIWVSLLSYAYFPLLLVNIGFVVLWLLAGSRWFLLPTVVIVVRCAFIPLYFQMGGETEAHSGNTLKVMTYNVHGYHGRDFVSALNTNLGQIDSNVATFLAIIDKEQPDVMCLQEFTQKAHCTAVRDSIEARGYLFSASARPGEERYNTVVFSRFPLLPSEYIDSSELLAVDVVKGDDTVRVMNLHLKSYKLDEDDYQRLSATRHGIMRADSVRSTLRKMRKASLAHEREWTVVEPFLKSAPHPYIVAGDFNDTPASYFYQKTKPYLKDSYKECGKGFCTTYHGNFPAFRIDYLLHTDSIDAVEYKRLKSDLSDHYPLFSTFRIGKTAYTYEQQKEDQEKAAAQQQAQLKGHKKRK